MPRQILPKTQYFYLAIGLVPWSLCLVSTIIWVFLTSAPSSVSRTFIWFGALFLPAIGCACFLGFQAYRKSTKQPNPTNYHQTVFNTLRSGICSVNLTCVTTWILLKMLSGCVSFLEPINDEDKMMNVLEGIIWICMSILMLGFIGIWGAVQAPIWWVTYAYIKNMRQAETERCTRADQEEELGMLGEKGGI